MRGYEQVSANGRESRVLNLYSQLAPIYSTSPTGSLVYSPSLEQPRLPGLPSCSPPFTFLSEPDSRFTRTQPPLPFPTLLPLPASWLYKLSTLDSRPFADTCSCPLIAIHLPWWWEAIRSSETSVLTKSTWRKIPEDGFLHSHRRENLRSYKNVFSLPLSHSCITSCRELCSFLKKSHQCWFFCFPGCIFTSRITSQLPSRVHTNNNACLTSFESQFICKLSSVY
jgi:hypothetical protein